MDIFPLLSLEKQNDLTVAKHWIELKQILSEGTPQQIKRREYQRKYQSQIKAGIVALEQDEIDCLEELDRIRKEKSRLIDEIAKANEQANMILQEKYTSYLCINFIHLCSFPYFIQIDLLNSCDNL